MKERMEERNARKTTSSVLATREENYEMAWHELKDRLKEIERVEKIYNHRTVEKSSE